MMIMIITVGPLEGYKNISHERTKFFADDDVDDNDEGNDDANI